MWYLSILTLHTWEDVLYVPDQQQVEEHFYLGMLTPRILEDIIYGCTYINPTYLGRRALCTPLSGYVNPTLSMDVH